MTKVNTMGLKPILVLSLTIVSVDLLAQNGYVKLSSNDSVFVGYLKYYTSISDGQQGIELWKDKKDKTPQRIPKSEITEYAIKKDTVRLFHHFKPFPESDLYFDMAEAQIISRGKLNLFAVNNAKNQVSTATGGGLIPALIDQSLGNVSYIYVIENSSSGYVRALSPKKEKLIEVLPDFFPERYLTKYEEVKGEISYKSIPALVKLYNSK